LNIVLNMNIDTILSLSYELEGLLMLAKSRGESTPEAVWQQLLEKANAVNVATVALVEQATANTLAERSVSIEESAPAEEPESVEETDDVEEPAPSESFASAEVPETPEVSEAPEVPTEPETAAPYAEAGVADEAAEEVPLESDDTEVEVADEGVEEVVEDESADDDAVEEEPEVAAEPMRLDEKLARESSRNLRKAFSLNDRFRFRRELFGNSDIEMSDTLNLVEAMSSYAEAVDYFMTDLQWDAENPEVAEFMAIIEKHFATR
jgi:hypothetical protein